jgi:hypothetical protein
VVGALLAPAVYALARVHLARGAALLAAAIAVLDPMAVVLSHQARIHVPGITLLVAAAIPMARLLARAAGDARAATGASGRVGFRLALGAGAAAGAAAAIFQLGFLLASAGGLCLLLRARPLRRAAGPGLLLAAGFGLAFGALVTATRLTGAVTLAPGRSPLDDAATLGMHASAVAFHASRIPAMLLGWALVSPERVVALLAGARRRGFGDAGAGRLLLCLVYPLLIFVVVGAGIGPQPRYSLSCTPFLAVPAAAACLALRRPAWRTVLATLLVLAPLAGSIRHDVLLGRADTRQLLADALVDWSRRGHRVAVESALVLGSRRLPPGVRHFPPGSDFRAWGAGVEARRGMLAAAPADILACSLSTRVDLSADAEVMGRLGWRLVDVIDPGRWERSFMPHDPLYVVPDVWLAKHPGPRIEFWQRSD